MKGKSPTARSLDLLRRRGFEAEVVERWLPIGTKDKDGQPIKIRRDLFGCIDIVAVHSSVAGALGVQATSASNMSARLNKAKTLKPIAVWLKAQNRFEVWGWWVNPGSACWEVRVAELRLDDMAAVELVKPGRRKPSKKDRVRQQETFQFLD
jgi:hypothetical protein